MEYSRDIEQEFGIVESLRACLDGDFLKVVAVERLYELLSLCQRDNDGVINLPVLLRDENLPHAKLL